MPVFPFSVEASGEGWLDGWDNRIMFNLDQNDIAAELTNFTVLIHLSETSGRNSEDVSFIFDEVGANSLKIAVTQDDGTTECYVEIEDWDSGSEEAWLWARVASAIASDSNTELFFYYDNEHADNTDYIGATNSAAGNNAWDDDYVSVYHMADGADNQHIYDSTVSGLDGTKNGGGQPTEEAGVAGLSQDFDGDDWIDVGTYPTFTNVTAESFWQTDQTTDGAAPLGMTEENNDEDRIMQIIGSDVLRSYFRTDGVTVNPGIAFTDTASYHYFVTTRAATVIKGYMEGIYDSDFDETVGTGTIQDLTGSGIGCIGSTKGYLWDGNIDEVRFSSLVRSDSWIGATYQTLIDDLLDWGGDVVHDTISASDPTPAIDQWFSLNVTLDVYSDASTYEFTRIDINPLGLNLSLSYTNGTGFAEENDPNGYMEINVGSSSQSDDGSSGVNVGYYIRFLSGMTKRGWIDVKVYSTDTATANDTDTFSAVFYLPPTASWLDGWDYRVNLTITGSPSGAVSNYPMDIRVYNATLPPDPLTEWADKRSSGTVGTSIMLRFGDMTHFCYKIALGGNDFKIQTRSYNHTSDVWGDIWSSETLTNTYEYHPTSSMGINSTGFLHLVYGWHKDESKPIRYRVSTNANDTSAWGSASTIATEFFGYPNLAIDSNDKLHLIYRGGGGGGDGDYYYRSKEMAGSWSAALNIIDGEAAYAPAYEMSIVIDSNDVIHIGAHFLLRADSKGKRSGYMKSVDGATWTMANGTEYSLPVTYATLENIETETEVQLGNLVVDAYDLPAFTTVINYMDATPNGYYNFWRYDGSDWVNTSIPSPAGKDATPYPATGYYDGEYFLFLPASDDGAWNSITTENFLYTSTDNGSTFTDRGQITQTDDTRAHFIGNAEKVTSANTMSEMRFAYISGDLNPSQLFVGVLDENYDMTYLTDRDYYNVDTEGNANVDFSDIRFYTEANVSLSYYQGETVNESYALFTFNVTQIPASPDEIVVYMYYGNSEATSTSSGSDTFIEFWDMEGTPGEDPTGFTDASAASCEYDISATYALTGDDSARGIDENGEAGARLDLTDDVSADFQVLAGSYYVPAAGPSVGVNIYRTGTTDLIGSITFTGLGQLSVRDGEAGFTVVGGFRYAEWHQIEIYVNYTSETYDVYFNEALVAVDYDFYTSVQDARSFSLPSGAASDSAVYWYFDDLLAKQSIDVEPTLGVGAAEGGNEDPTITSASSPDLDDGDNAYEMESYYTFVIVVEDEQGASSIDMVYLQGAQGTTPRFEVRATDLTGTPAYAIQTGVTIIDIDSGNCVWAEDGTTGTLTLKIRFEFDFTDEADLELRVYVEDSEAASAGFTTKQTDYFDVIGRLVTSNLAATDARINKGSATTFGGNVNYATTVGGDTASTKYPPDAQFTAVHIHNAAHTTQGNDASIVNGAFSGISVTIPDAVQSNTYHVYLDMAGDYTDADAPDGDTASVIGDALKCTAFTRDVANQKLNVRMLYAYDSTAAEGGTVAFVGISGTANSEGWAEISLSGASNFDWGEEAYGTTDAVFDITATSENQTITLARYGQLIGGNAEVDDTSTWNGVSLVLDYSVGLGDYYTEIVTTTPSYIYNVAYDLGTDLSGGLLTLTHDGMMSITMARQSWSGTFVQAVPSGYLTLATMADNILTLNVSSATSVTDVLIVDCTGRGSPQETTGFDSTPLYLEPDLTGPYTTNVILTVDWRLGGSSGEPGPVGNGDAGGIITVLTTYIPSINLIAIQGQMNEGVFDISWSSPVTAINIRLITFFDLADWFALNDSAPYRLEDTTMNPKKQDSLLFTVTPDADATLGEYTIPVEFQLAEGGAANTVIYLSVIEPITVTIPGPGIPDVVGLMIGIGFLVAIGITLIRRSQNNGGGGRFRV